MASPLTRSSTVLALVVGAAGLAEPLRLAAETQRAFEQFDVGAEKLARARIAATALVAREVPRASAREWEGLAEAFEAAARTLQGAPELPLPEPVAGVTPEQLRTCATRPGALARAERAVRALQAGGQRCSETRAQLKERRTAAQAADEGWRALGKALGRLGDATEFFPPRWLEAQAAVPRALASYQEALKRQEDRVDRCQGELKARATTLAAVAGEVGRAHDCGLAGQWAGASTHAGTVSGVTLELVSAGGVWSGTANIDGRRLAVRAASLAGSVWAISLDDGHASLSGALSADGRTFAGTYSSAEGPASFTLHRQ